MSKKIKKNLKNSSSNRESARSGVSKPSPPVALGGIARSKTPKFGQSQSTNGVVIRRREFVGTATNSSFTTFYLSSLSSSTPGYDLNPLCTSTFPWLSHLAGCYERYRFRALKFDMIPSQATTTAGRYYCAVDYDYDDAPASSKAELMGNATAAEAPIWQTMTVVCDPASLNRDCPFRYVSCSTRGFDFEPRTTYAGFFMIGFDTPTANCLIDIWVEYEVELVTPVFESSNSIDVPISGHTAITNVTAAAGTDYFGTLTATTPIKSGLVSRVTAGLGNVPSMLVPVGGVTKNVTDGLDIALAGFRGVIDIMSDVGVTGATPAATIGTNQLDLRVGVFDNIGSYLGDAFYGTTQAIKSVGPRVASELLTNDKYTRHLVSVGMEELRKYMPTARYLMPWITSTVAALGGGYHAFGWQHSDV